VGGACDTLGTGNETVQGFGGKSDGKRPLGRPRLRWEYRIRKDLKEIVGGGEWIQLAQDRDRWRAVANMVMNLRILTPRS
jgi:hypothetical protein